MDSTKILSINMPNVISIGVILLFWVAFFWIGGKLVRQAQAGGSPAQVGAGDGSMGYGA